MEAQIPLRDFTEALGLLFEETFERVHGVYLDEGTSLFETLADVSAAEASRRISAHCACIAAQVDHVCFYLELTVRMARGEEVGPVDWAATWRLTSVTEAEWAALNERLRAAHRALLDLAAAPGAWEQEGAIRGALGVLAHNAYHLGEIRQALGVLRG